MVYLLPLSGTPVDHSCKHMIWEQKQEPPASDRNANACLYTQKARLISLQSWCVSGEWRENGYTIYSSGSVGPLCSCLDTDR